MQGARDSKLQRPGFMTAQHAIGLGEISGAEAGLNALPACMVQGAELDLPDQEPEAKAGDTKLPAQPAGSDGGSAGLLGTMLRGLNAVGFDLAHLSKCAGQGTSHAQSIAQASERLFVTVFEIQQAAGEASSEAEAADESAANGLSAVKNAIAAMQKIAAAVDETAQKLDSLSRASERIDEILSLTANIASQTKLLALNATIEAVRAGDAGRSFAVVAAEVKRLADQSAKASEEIKTDLADLTSGMSLIVSTMAQTTGAVTEGEKAITEAGSTMEAMSRQVSSVAQKMKDITKTVEAESGITAEVAQWVDKITTTSNDGAEKLRSAAQKMRAGNNWFYAAADRLTSFDTPEAACEAFKLDHLMLARQVTDVLLGTGDLQPEDAANASDCRLQEWLDDSETAGFVDPELLEEIRTLHAQTHELASGTVKPEDDPEVCAALELFAQFNDANTRLCRLLTTLSQQARD
jgi:methyl-accepting chemotaxis protein